MEISLTLEFKAAAECAPRRLVQDLELLNVTRKGQRSLCAAIVAARYLQRGVEHALFNLVSEGLLREARADVEGEFLLEVRDDIALVLLLPLLLRAAGGVYMAFIPHSRDCALLLWVYVWTFGA